MRYIPKFGGIELNRSLSQLSYRPIYEAVLFPVRCYDPENIDIIAAFGTFVKAFFQIPAQTEIVILSARGSKNLPHLFFYHKTRGIADETGVKSGAAIQDD